MIMTYGQIAIKRDIARVALQPIAISAELLTIEIVRARVSNDLGICAKCKTGEYLTLSITIADIICQGCGEWQEAILNDVYARVDL